jgi:hypothetical protein
MLSVCYKKKRKRFWGVEKEAICHRENRRNCISVRSVESYMLSIIGMVIDGVPRIVLKSMSQRRRNERI